jgi:hypothetical protein
MEPLRNTLLNKIFVPVLLSSSIFITACGGGTDSNNSQVQGINSPSLDMNIPASVSGGTQQVTPQAQFMAATVTGSQQVVSAVESGTGQPCTHIGVDQDDPFRNGYQITKLLVSAVATWTCIADVLIDVAAYVPNDGQIHETDNIKSTPGYDREDPTHYSVTSDSETQTTVRLYYNYDRLTPPQVGEDPQFFISWNSTSKDIIDGRMIIDGLKINPDDRKEKDPTMMRMDFNYTAAEKNADIFMQFDNGNPWAEGFRIHVKKDLTANPLRDVFLARGLIKMKAQFLPVSGITEIPNIQMFTVSDSFGNGAAIAEFQDVSLPMELNATSNNHLGNYLFTKNDVYYFDYDSDWDYINKTITSSAFRGGRTTPATGGTWVPFDPSLDVIISGLALDASYFTGSLCANDGDDCNDLLNAAFADGFAGQEKNQGSDPLDWRSAILAQPAYLDSVYPNGSSWDGAFDYSYLPAL